MDELIRFADELGPAKILHVYEPKSGLKAILVVDNVAAGPSIGGIRMAEDVSVEECFRLARAMTLKNISAGLPHGGGKVVIYGDPKMDKTKKEVIMRALANSLRDIKEYVLAPDMGTNEECMAWIHDEEPRVVGKPAELGGIPLDQIGATGWGLFHAIDVTAEHCGLELDGATFVVQGYGAVGRHAAQFLAEKGAVMVGVSDSGGAITNPKGIDIKTLGALKDRGKGVLQYSQAESIHPEELLAITCDIWIPAARPDVINDNNVSLMQTRIVAQGANIPCTEKAERYLHQKGVFCLPDFIVNAGGVICAATEYRGAGELQAMERIKHTLRSNTREILMRSKERSIPLRMAADEFARERLLKIMATRRWSII
ncbi:Glu/Leu/Phe/Val family dehydrogenase [Desulfosediminicola ganghwensis]|uniref:Glu/Leu/Phe/Val family dehydrogenase n=1 Tax=Desulfosediminicola ganghwensis TaxID=2569540 RepID=UPI0010ABC012|nr:Glu/Leu/Phe/Val dehydrogenase [Desulfosediminicola ganghwensis]